MMELCNWSWPCTGRVAEAAAEAEAAAAACGAPEKLIIQVNAGKNVRSFGWKIFNYTA